MSYALEDELLIESIYKMHKSVDLLKEKEDYIVRLNRLEDQEQMAHIKIDGWRNTYEQIIASKYLKGLNYKELTERYCRSFEEFKDKVLVAVRGSEVIGYSYFESKPKSFKYDSELISLYIKTSELRKGIGKTLFKETAKELYSRGCHNMIVWCLKGNDNAFKFYESLGGINSETKIAKIGDESYEEYGFYFDLDQFNNDEVI